MSTAICSFLFISLLFATTTCESEIHNIYIRGGETSYSNSCLFSNASSDPCPDLDWVFDNLTDLSYTRLILSAGNHFIFHSPHSFENVTDMIFVGSPSTITCGEDVGFAFINATNISLFNINFESCSTLRNSTSKLFDGKNSRNISKFNVALYFEGCTSVYMDSVGVNFSPNGTGMALFDTSGNSTFMNCVFSYNIISDDDEISTGTDLGGGGGGVLLELTYCKPGKYCNKTDGYIQGSYNEFIGCSFLNNVARSYGRGGFIYPKEMNHQSLGRGGGLMVSIKGNNSETTVVIDNCVFGSNEALWGGGLYVGIYDSASGSNVFIRNSIFANNSASILSGGGGGGARLVHYIVENPYSLLNSFHVDNSSFRNNTAINGGGLVLTWTRQSTPAKFTVFNSGFEYNFARLGSAIYIYQFWKLIQHTGIMPSIELMNCEFLSNSNQWYEKIPLEFQNDGQELGIGVLYISSSNVRFINFIKFIGNTGSALAISDGSALIENTTVMFVENQGMVGGAIALLGPSTLDLGEGTDMMFHNNTALMHGGALYAQIVSRQTRESDSNCFVRYAGQVLDSNEWKISMIFINNTDHGGKKTNSIHATSILPCRDISLADGSKCEAFCWLGWEYYDNIEQYRSHNLSFCEDHISTNVGKVIKQSGGQAIPGKKFKLPINISDDLNATLRNNDIFFYIQFKDNMTSNEVIPFNSDVTLRDTVNTTVYATLRAAGERPWIIDVAIHLNACPPGYYYDNITSSCTCYPYKPSFVTCDDKEVKIAKNIWMGSVGDNYTHYYVVECPYHYCVERSKPLTTLNDTIVDNEMCRNNRRGIICGECFKNYGPIVNDQDFECILCNNTNIASKITIYLASVYLPLSVLFFLIIVFDIRLTSGPANSFIFYSQVVASTFSLDADGGIPMNSIMPFSCQGAGILMKIYKFPYDIFNLNFNIESKVCLSSNMDTLSAMCLEYGVAFLPLAVIAASIALANIKICRWETTTRESWIISCLRKRLNIMHNALLPAFATFFLLSYTKFGTVSSYLMTTTKLDDNISRMYLAGQYDSNTKEYWVYFSLGVVIFTTFVATAPLLLLDFPLRAVEAIIFKFSILNKIYPTIKIHILLDTFQGCYRKDCRYFAGLYFLWRLITILAYALSDTWILRFMIQQIVVTVMIILLSIFRPYRADLNFLNYVDILIFSNLAFLNVVTLYLHVIYKVDPKSTSTINIILFSVQYVAVFLPLVYMVGYLVVYCKKFRTNANHQEVIFEDSSDIILDRARTMNHYRQPRHTLDESTGLLRNLPSNPSYNSNKRSNNSEQNNSIRESLNSVEQTHERNTSFYDISSSRYRKTM